MKKVLGMLATFAIVGGSVMAADYTPASKEDAVIVASQSVTNGQDVTIVSGLNRLTAIGGAADSTNTVTLAAPGKVGVRAIIVVPTGGTNLVGIADSGTASLSAAFVGDGGDTLSLISITTGVWAKITSSAN